MSGARTGQYRVVYLIDDAACEVTIFKAGHRRNILQWPEERKRALIQQFARNDNTLKQKLTLAARKGEDTEADMDSFIEDLIDLGVIDDEGNAT